MSITVHISGGLGNQLFQYATGRALALRRGSKLSLDISSFTQSGNLRSYNLDNYQIQAHPLKSKNWLHQKISNILRSGLGLSTDGRVQAELSNIFDSTILDLSDGAYLLGHWQSEKYFIDHADTIKSELTLKRQLPPKRLKLLNNMGKKSSVAVHVRRGDYVSNPVAQSVLGTLSPSYYKKAVEYLKSKVESVHIFIFSDDPVWASENILTDYPNKTYLPTSKSPHEDLELMRSCDHFIIANSSFSWWGAWLGSDKDSIIIAPRKWFRSHSFSSKDLIPSRWIQL